MIKFLKEIKINPTKLNPKDLKQGNKITFTQAIYYKHDMNEPDREEWQGVVFDNSYEEFDKNYFRYSIIVNDVVGITNPNVKLDRTIIRYYESPKEEFEADANEEFNSVKKIQ